VNEFEALLEKLCAASREDFANPYEAFTWPATLPPDRWYMNPGWISLHGTEAWSALDEAARRTLSFHEVVNFFSLNIHGEKALVEGLSRRLYEGESKSITEYLHHFLDEENKHMVYFGGFCQRYAGKIYTDRTVTFPAEYAEGEEEFLFFAKVMIFEELVDVYNVHHARDESIEPLTRTIHRLHHEDEARHLAFGRRQVRRLFERHAPGWDAATLARVRSYLVDYLKMTWAQYYNPDVYRDAGVPEPYRVRESALSHPDRRAHRDLVSRNCLRHLRESGILLEDVAA
jgi:hypothetical protein